MEPIYFSSTDLAEMLHCSEATISNYVRDGRLPRPTIRARAWWWHKDALSLHARKKLRRDLANPPPDDPEELPIPVVRLRAPGTPTNHRT